jgi:hypothetical protein
MRLALSGLLIGLPIYVGRGGGPGPAITTGEVVVRGVSRDFRIRLSPDVGQVQLEALE